MSVEEQISDAINILEKAQRRYPNGEVLIRERVRQELLEICDIVRDAADDGPLVLKVIEWSTIVAEPLDQEAEAIHPSWQPNVSKAKRKAHRRRLDTPRDVLFGLRRMSKAKRPLSSTYCRDLVVTYLNQALRTHERHWLQRKGIELTHPVQHIKSRSMRFTSEDHELLRHLIQCKIIPILTLMNKQQNALKPWKQTGVLMLADLFARYAPPKDYDLLGSARLPEGAMTLFIRFLYEVFQFIDIDDNTTPQSLSNYWKARQNIMRGEFVRE